MKISKTSIDDLNVVVTITIEKQDYEATVNETLKDYRKKANMPGFRKGMVPSGLIKKLYGKSALGDTINKLLGAELNKFIADENLNILGEPLPSASVPSNADFEKWGDFEFSFDLGLSPQINVDFEKLGPLPYYEIEVNEENVDKQIETYANRFGSNVTAEAFGEQETAIGDFIEVDGEGNGTDGGVTAENVRVAYKLLVDESVKQQVIGAKVGDVLKFNPKVAFANDHEVTHLLKVKHEEIDLVDKDFNFIIKEIETFVPAQIDEELIKKVNGEDSDITTVEAFRTKIASDIKNNLVYSSNYKFLIDTKSAISTALALQLPEEFLKRWLKETNEKITNEQIEEEFDHFKEDLVWTLIKGKLARENELKVDEPDMLVMAREMARMQFYQYGMYSIPDEYLDNYAKSLIENKEQRHKMGEKIIEDKVMELIKQKAELTTKQLTQKEFDDLFEK